MDNEKFQQVVLEKLEALTDGQKRLEDRMTGIESEVSNLKNQVTGIDSKVTGFDSRLGSLEESVRHIQEQTAGLLEFRKETKDSLAAIAETQSVISGILGEHEIQIRRIIKRIV